MAYRRAKQARFSLTERCFYLIIDRFAVILERKTEYSSSEGISDLVLCRERRKILTESNK